MKRIIFILLFLLFASGFGLKAQISFGSLKDYDPVDYYPVNRLDFWRARSYVAKVNGQDVIMVMLPDVWIYPPMKFRNKQEEMYYWNLVRNIKMLLPYAKYAYYTIIETYQYIQTLSSDKQKREHISRVKRDLFNEYKPILRKMSRSQGKLLLKLIDRECNQTSYDIIKAFLGPFQAGFWNLFASLFGASLRSKYDPNGQDAMMERVVNLVEEGAI